MAAFMSPLPHKDRKTRKKLVIQREHKLSLTILGMKSFSVIKIFESMFHVDTCYFIFKVISNIVSLIF